MQDPAPRPCATQGMAGVAMANPAEIARQLHDGLAQQLAFALIQLDAAQDPSHPQRDVALSQGRQLIKTCLCVVRDTVHHLHTGASPGSTDLPAQLRALCRELLLLGHARLVLDCPETLPALPEPVAGHLARASRELLINACKHASGASTCLSVRLLEDTHPGLLITIGDNGPGFDPQTLPAQGGFGLRDMPAYLAAIGAEFTLRAKPGKGVWAQIRWQANEQGAQTGATPAVHSLGAA